MSLDNEQIIVQYTNCVQLKDHKLVHDDFWVRNGKIINPEVLFYVEKLKSQKVIDCNNALICPGFIDTQINGAFGEDFSDENGDFEKSLEKVSKGLLAHGVTSYCPTIVTSSPKHYKRILSKSHKRKGDHLGAGIIGLHIEGPFIAKLQKGAHTESYIQEFGNRPIEKLDEIYGRENLLRETSILTLAPELLNSDTVINYLTDNHIVTSLDTPLYVLIRFEGHSSANLSEAEKAVKNGAKFITHLFNAMLPFHHRDPHIVGLLTSDKLNGNPIYYGMIADGIHTAESALRIAHRSHPKGLVLVTDAIAAMGLGCGTYVLGAQKIEVKVQGYTKKAVLYGTNTLCGSIASLNECVQFLLNNTDCDEVEAIECATLHPAQLLNITHSKGTLDYGTDADFLMLDRTTLKVKSTYINGECTYTNCN